MSHFHQKSKNKGLIGQQTEPCKSRLCAAGAQIEHSIELLHTAVSGWLAISSAVYGNQDFHGVGESEVSNVCFS